MSKFLEKMGLSCCIPAGQRVERSNDNDDHDNDNLEDSLLNNPLFWTKDLERHFYGDLSFAICQASDPRMEYSQVETGREATFVGIYDGHFPPGARLSARRSASRYVSRHLFNSLKRIALKEGTISEDSLRRAIMKTEGGFLRYVDKHFAKVPLTAAVGSCCLIGVICRGTLYVANVGDSRAVIGFLDGSQNMEAEQFSNSHSVALPEIRDELNALYQHDPLVVTKENNVYRLRGLIEVSRAIGDVFMKDPIRYDHPSIWAAFKRPGRIPYPVLRAEPSLHNRVLQDTDKFLIFASRGLWEIFTAREAVDIVNKYPPEGIARRLVQSALKKVAMKTQKTFDELLEVPKGDRRSFHGDISVIVIFIDHNMQRQGIYAAVPQLSVSGFKDEVQTSKFNFIRLPTIDEEPEGTSSDSSSQSDEASTSTSPLPSDTKASTSKSTSGQSSEESSSHQT